MDDLKPIPQIFLESDEFDQFFRTPQERDCIGGYWTTEDRNPEPIKAQVL
jgi:hypothetical protein